MNRVVFAVLALALLVAACAERRGDSLAPTSSEETTPAAASSPSVEDETNGAGTFTYEVWFAGSEGFLFVSKRTAKLEPAVARVALESLLAGPSQAETAAGVFTAVPDGTELLGLDIEEGIATVDLSSEYAQGSGSWAEFLRLAQVVYTLTPVPDGGGSEVPARRRARADIRRARHLPRGADGPPRLPGLSSSHSSLRAWLRAAHDGDHLAERPLLQEVFAPLDA